MMDGPQRGIHGGPFLGEKGGKCMQIEINQGLLALVEGDITKEETDAFAGELKKLI
jgi:hypothetical protein